MPFLGVDRNGFGKSKYGGFHGRGQMTLPPPFVSPVRMCGVRASLENMAQGMVEQLLCRLDRCEFFNVQKLRNLIYSKKPHKCVLKRGFNDGRSFTRQNTFNPFLDRL